ncbi:MAG: 16S rRNA (guanine(527)-N(7))-methyltransferase RsmG [Acidimicrobiales bacterium]
MAPVARRTTPQLLELVDQDRQGLLPLLEEARSLGFLGPGDVDDQLSRSLAFTAVATAPPAWAVDLGSGGGLPALVLALAWPASRWLLVDSNQRRARWLTLTIGVLGVDSRCQVVCERAELLARGPDRHRADLVTARALGPPGPTAECGAPLLHVGGELLVADPPQGGPGRWPARGLARLGLVLSGAETVATSAGPVSISRLSCQRGCPEAYPRRVGVPFKRPLF